MALAPLASLLLLACPERRPAAPDLAFEAKFPPPPAREPGPPRPETAAQREGAAREAGELTRALLAGGIQPREVASVADVRGYRLYRRRFFGQARAWFRAAASADPGHELSLYNGARCAALLGAQGEARALLDRLRRLRTPLARARLRLSESDPDLAALRP